MPFFFTYCSDAWRRRRAGGLKKRNHAEETESFQTLEEALGDNIKALSHNDADLDDEKKNKMNEME